MPEPPTWRTALGQIIKKPGARQRLAEALGITSVTLWRWVEHISDPRPDKLRRLLAMLPEEQAMLLPLITQEFPAFSMVVSETEEGSEEIPSAFYAHVHDLLATLPSWQTFWSLRKLILQQAYEHLDPDHRNVVITLARCFPPADGHRVRSLHVLMGVGVAPWGGDLDQQNIFLGAESVAGRAASSGQPQTIQNLQESRLLPPPNMAGLASMSIYPLRRASRIGGTCAFVSAQTEYFVPSRLTLVQQYANLLALTFAPEDFYAPQDIGLAVMPPPPLQVPYLADFYKRVTHVLREAQETGQAITNAQAEQVVWRHLEDELAHLALVTEG